MFEPGFTKEAILIPGVNAIGKGIKAGMGALSSGKIPIGEAFSKGTAAAEKYLGSKGLESANALRNMGYGALGGAGVGALTGGDLSSTLAGGMAGAALGGAGSVKAKNKPNVSNSGPNKAPNKVQFSSGFSKSSSISFEPGFSEKLSGIANKALMGGIMGAVPGAALGYATADNPGYQLGTANGMPSIAQTSGNSGLWGAVKGGLVGAGLGATAGAGRAAYKKHMMKPINTVAPEIKPKTMPGVGSSQFIKNASLNFSPGFTKRASGINDTYTNTETGAIESKRDNRKYLIPGGATYAPSNSLKGQNIPGNNIGPQVVPGLK